MENKIMFSVRLWQTPSFKHRHKIKRLVRSLSDIKEFASTTTAVMLRTGHTAWLSSHPSLTFKIIKAGYHRGDLLLNHQYSNNNRVVFPGDFSEIDEHQAGINALLRDYNYWRAYCITRTCEDCNIMTTFNTNVEIKNKLAFYQKTIAQLEHYLVDFFDETMTIFSENLPALRRSRFALDKSYRDRVLLNREWLARDSIKLSAAEVEILYWSAQGKSALEIAVILTLAKTTVDTYRRKLIEKLNVSNITQAVYVAASSGLIT